MGCGMSETIDYTVYGITFEPGAVCKPADVVLRNPAQIVRVVDITLAANHFGNDVVTGWLNGSSSPTVTSQRIGRDNNGETAEWMRNAVYQSLRGARATRSRVATTVTVRTLPNGATFTGTTVEEFRAAFVAAMHDMGVPNDRAIAAAQKITF